MPHGLRRPTRHRCRTAGVCLTAALTLLVAACGAPGTSSSNGDGPVAATKPDKPIQLTVLDGSGDLKGGGQAAIDAFVKANPDLVSRVNYETAAAPDVVGKLRAQSAAGSVNISLVLGGYDVYSSTKDLVVDQLPDDSGLLPDLSTIQDEPRKKMQDLAGGKGLLINFDQNGPLVAYKPSSLKKSEVPTTPEAILEWAKAHKGKFSYAQPAASGSGRTWLMSLPYMLGDSNPADPEKGWTKTWAYLADLGKYVSSYPASSTLLAQQFASGQLDLIPTITAHDIQNRSTGTWPPTTGVSLFDKQYWIMDAHYALIPKGVSGETLYVLKKLESAMLQPGAQNFRLGSGVLTTANKMATAENATSDSKTFVDKWGRPDFYPSAMKSGTVQVPLSPDALQKAFDLWTRNVGSKVGG